MSYKLAFLPSAKKEWDALGHTVREQFKKKLARVLENPHVPANRLSGQQNLYKIKLRSSGYRLAYEVIDDKLFVYVISVGKRDKNKIYKNMKKRLE